VPEGPRTLRRRRAVFPGDERSRMATGRGGCRCHGRGWQLPGARSERGSRSADGGARWPARPARKPLRRPRRSVAVRGHPHLALRRGAAFLDSVDTADTWRDGFRLGRVGWQADMAASARGPCELEADGGGSVPGAPGSGLGGPLPPQARDAHSQGAAPVRRTGVAQPMRRVTHEHRGPQGRPLTAGLLRCGPLGLRLGPLPLCLGLRIWVVAAA
jgi:hypothetical protein